MGYGTEITQKWEHHIEETYPEIKDVYYMFLYITQKPKCYMNGLGLRYTKNSMMVGI